MKLPLGKKARDFIFDFESCFEDSDFRKQTNPEDYKNSFIEAHMRGFRG